MIAAGCVMATISRRPAGPGGRHDGRARRGDPFAGRIYDRRPRLPSVRSSPRWCSNASPRETSVSFQPARRRWPSDLRAALPDGQADRRRFHQSAARPTRAPGRQARPREQAFARTEGDASGRRGVRAWCSRTPRRSRCAAPASCSPRSGSWGRFIPTGSPPSPSIRRNSTRTVTGRAAEPGHRSRGIERSRRPVPPSAASAPAGSACCSRAAATCSSQVHRQRFADAHPGRAARDHRRARRLAVLGRRSPGASSG